MKKILLIATGGTIACKRTENGLTPLITSDDLIAFVPKAKELRRFVEPLITLAKVDTVANRRLAFARLRDEAVVAKLFNVIGKLSANRNGGYTRILKAGLRACDRAPVAYIMLTDRPEVAEEEKAAE